MNQSANQTWWDSLRHFGLLLSPPEVGHIQRDFPVPPLSDYLVSQLRRDINRLDSGEHSPSEFVSRTMPTVFGFSTRGVGIGTGTWYRGSNVPSEFTHILVSGESLKPQHIWKGSNGGRLPIFLDSGKKVGIGRGRKHVSDVIQWLRQEKCPLAIVTNARQWRLVHAGLDFDAQAESDLELWFQEGGIGPQLAGLRQLVQPALLDGEPVPLAEAIAASRRGHAELSAELGERVREAVEAIVRSHGEALKEAGLQDEGSAIYRAAVRVVMRMVVVLFAESRDLLPRSNPVYHGGYGLQGLAEQLNRLAARSRGRLAHRHSAWPQVLALFRLVYEGSEHEALPIPAYGGDLFTPGSPFVVPPSDGPQPDGTTPDPMCGALHVFETACFDSSRNVMPDSVTHRILDLLTRTRVRIRQGRGSTTTVVPVDFQDLSSEYIGILYEGLLDYELRTAPEDDAIVFLAIGNEPALPLSRLQDMEPKQIKALLETLKDTSSPDGDEEEDLEGDPAGQQDDEPGDNDRDAGGDDLEGDPAGQQDDEPSGDDEEALPLREQIRARALEWTRTACNVGGLVTKPRGSMTPEKRLAYDRKLESKAKQLVRRMVLPGEWYLVRWGGTRKGSGTFYTRPQLAVPTVQRTLAPLCYCGGPAPTPPLGGVATPPRPTSSLCDCDRSARCAAPVAGALPAATRHPSPSIASPREAPATVPPYGVPGEAGRSDGGTCNGRSGGTRSSSGGAGAEPLPSHLPRGASATACSIEEAQRTSSNEHAEMRGPGSRDAPAAGGMPPPLRPRKPEEILALKVCDPACGSGSFLVAAVRYLTDAVYASLYAHGRLEGDVDRTLVNLLGHREADYAARLADEMIPCRPDDELFEPRLKAVLRRWVVERCIYGVDLDPLAVELCRLSVWIETMDRDLPFSFLDHKIKCGNSLVGAWFDQFMHYPAMAWKGRDAGDTGHTNGVHFGKGEQTQALKTFVQDVLTPDLVHSIKTEQRELFLHGGLDREAQSAVELHDEAFRVLNEIHSLPVHETAERARLYRELVASAAWLRLKRSFDAWCAVWFWPTDDLDHAPLPSNWHDLPAETARQIDALGAQQRFFHWELEFPDVFSSREGELKTYAGFDAILGNPPWDTAKPVSKEFFSNTDPLYRSYGKQDALRIQTALFDNESVEADWLNYSADFKSLSQFTKYAASPWGDPKSDHSSGDRFSLGRGKLNNELHDLWRRQRQDAPGFADPAHSFTRQGGGDSNLYKLFLEQGHALLRDGGRMGFIVPSGVYSDHGTGPLRELFLDHCRWEWLFGFENRDGIFPDVDGRFKFNPVIIQKGGRTEAIQTAFMRRKLEDWESAEQFATPYAREQVLQFSPLSKAILEIQSQRDLEVLTKIYANSVLLGDQSPNGWGIKYAREFDMTNDSKLFPPRPVWEEWGYRPDEYSRWIKGPWKPIAELWEELGIDPTSPVPSSPFPVPADDVQETACRVRCAQPPYDALPLPRADIPAGIILSRNADAWIHEDEIPIVTFTDANGKPLTVKEGRGKNAVEHEITGPAIALPLMQGAMINQYDYSQKGWLSGTGLRARWEPIGWTNKVVSPQFLMAAPVAGDAIARDSKPVVRRIARNTDRRTMICGLVPRVPCGDVASVLKPRPIGLRILLPTVLNSCVEDWVIRKKCVGTHVDYHYIADAPLVAAEARGTEDLQWCALALSGSSVLFGPEWVAVLSTQQKRPWQRLWACTDARRSELVVSADAILAALFGLSEDDLQRVLCGVDLPADADMSACEPTGFWRVDKDKPPEQRLTVLSLVAFHDLQEKIDACGGDIEKGIETFCTQNDGEGWMLPETLRLADYGLGHDDRAQQPQPVRECFGPRFYDWQLAQSPEESWRECHLHARNLLGEAGYQQLLADIEQGPGNGEQGTGKEPLKQPEPIDEVERLAAEEPPKDAWDDLPLFSGTRTGPNRVEPGTGS